MRIALNGKAVDIAATTLSHALTELGYDGTAVATAVNQAFVPQARRAATPLADGDAVEIVSPRQGG